MAQRSKSKCKDYKKAFHVCNGKENNLIIQEADMQEHVFMLPTPDIVKQLWVRGPGGLGQKMQLGFCKRADPREPHQGSQ